MVGLVWQLTWILLSGFWLMRTKDDDRYLWKPNGMSKRQINTFFLMWALFVLLVGAQAAQPWMTLWFLPTLAGWARVWLFYLDLARPGARHHGWSSAYGGRRLFTSATLLPRRRPQWTPDFLDPLLLGVCNLGRDAQIL